MRQQPDGTWVPEGLGRPQRQSEPAVEGLFIPDEGMPLPVAPMRDAVLLENQLRNSMQAESALQAEVTLLRDRVAQVTAQAQQGRERLLAGMCEMLAPLREVLTARGYQGLQDSQLVPVAVLALRPRAGVTQDHESVIQSDGTFDAVRRELPRWQSMVMDRLASLQQAVEALRPTKSMRPPMEVPSEPDRPEDASRPYPTWVLTDERQASLEEALLKEQTVRGGQAYGQAPLHREDVPDVQWR